MHQLGLGSTDLTFGWLWFSVVVFVSCREVSLMRVKAALTWLEPGKDHIWIVRSEVYVFI